MFELHSALAKDCALVGDLPLCRVLLMNDQQYPWLVLVPRREALREFIDLSEEDLAQYQRESNMTATLLQQLFAAEKLNIAALGNMVPQLHIHHIARFSDDVAWPKPVWGLLPAQAYGENALQQRLQKVRESYAQLGSELLV
ncbi:MAG: HIT domain-containing protein [Spongiibacteraceae bacterium]